MRAQVKHRSSGGHEEIATLRIETVEDYEMATRRIATLGTGTRDGSTEREREALLAAIQAWDAKHDDATGWKE